MLDRQQNRASIAELYKLRNQATHGGQLKSKAVETLNEVIEASSAIYQKLMARLLTIKAAPDWQDIELEPSPAEPS
ncbi:MAG: hypothetical protein WDN46_04490 [Methylocella sp.]